MPRQVGFHVYSVQVRQKRSHDYLLFSQVNGNDLLAVLCAGLKGVVATQANDEAAERVACLQRLDREGRTVTGLVEAGHYGSSANIVHSSTGQTVHIQATVEASMLPFFFRMLLPANKDRGLLIIQRDNRVQSKSMFVKLIKPIIEQIDPNLVCQLHPIMNKETFERLVGDGAVQQLKFIRLSVTPDFADEYDRGRDEIEGSMELTVKARRGRGLPMKRRLLEWMNSSRNVNDIYTVPGLDFEYDTVKADIRIGKTKRTIDFGNRLSTPIIDLTSQVQFDRSTGHPTYASLQLATADLAADQMFEQYGE